MRSLAVAGVVLFAQSLASADASEQLTVAPRVSIFASVSGSPIYEWEVVEAVYRRLPEWNDLTRDNDAQVAKIKAIRVQELRKLIERELAINELVTLMRQSNRQASLDMLNAAAARNADQCFDKVRKLAGLPTKSNLHDFVAQQGLTIAGLRRHFERDFMMRAYLGDLIKPKLSAITETDIRKYYDEHPEEFQVKESVKWQNLFVRMDRFSNEAEAKKHAESLVNRAKIEDFASLIDSDQGTSKLNGGYGFGGKRGEINPPDLEETIFAMKTSEVKMIRFSSGYHIVRIAERTYSGTRPFSEAEVCDTSRRRLEVQLAELETQRIMDAFWEKMKSQIIIEPVQPGAQIEDIIRRRMARTSGPGRY